MKFARCAAMLAAALLMMSAVSAAAAKPLPQTGTVVLPYDVIEGCAWSCTESPPGIVKCVSTEIRPDARWDGKAEIVYTFAGISAGSVDLYFRYLPDGGGEALNAWHIRLVSDGEGNVTEELFGVYETAYRSYDGGGPEYEVELSDASVVHLYGYQRYDRADHDEMTGAGYDRICGFSGRRPGTTEVTVTMRFFSEIEVVDRFVLNVDEDLRVTRQDVIRTEEK